MYLEFNHFCLSYRLKGGFVQRYMAVMDSNRSFAAMSIELEKTLPDKLSSSLGMMLEDSSWLGEMAKPSALPNDYFREFLGSNTIRVRRKKVDASILFSNTAFFTFFNSNAALEAVRFASAFFGKGQFASTEWKRNGNEIILSQHLIGPYYQPMDPKGSARRWGLE